MEKMLPSDWTPPVEEHFAPPAPPPRMFAGGAHVPPHVELYKAARAILDNLEELARRTDRIERLLDRTKQ